MDERDARSLLAEQLQRLDWSRGMTKAALVERLPGDNPLRGAVAQHLSDGTYFSPQDVLSALPDRVWEDAQVVAWRDAGFPGAVSQTPSPASPGVEGLAEPAAVAPPVEGEASGHGAVSSGQSDNGGTGRVDQVRQAVGQTAHGVAATATKVASQVKERAGAAVQESAGIADLPDRVRQTASQARDQVLSLRTRVAEPTSTGSEEVGAARRAVPAALSAVFEGLGQAYNRQPGKAVALVVLGLTLSTASGLNTWLARRVSGNEEIRIGPSRLRPLLLGFWAVTFAANLWDAWRNAGAAPAGAGLPGDAAMDSPSWRSLDPSRSAPSAEAAKAATDEYPTVGSG